MVTVVFILIAQVGASTEYYANPVDVLLQMYMVVALLAYGFAMCSLVVLRWTRPDVERPFKVSSGVQDIFLTC